MADATSSSAPDEFNPTSESGHPTQFTARRLTAIQSLRGIAALMVVFHHVIHQFPGFLAVIHTESGQAGVDIFFVISGFVMVFVTTDRERSPQQFLAMRAARIIPVYWFYTLAAATAMYFLPSLFRSNEFSFRHVILSLLFAPYRTQSDEVAPIIKQGWTLNYEVFFYVLFAIMMTISMTRRTMLATSSLATLAFIGYLAQFTGRNLGTMGFYFSNIILEFAFGMIIAAIYLRGRFQFLHPIHGTVLGTAGFIALSALDPLYTTSIRAWIYGIPAVMIVVGVLTLEGVFEGRGISILRFAGDASYSIYLVHIFPIAILRSIWQHYHISTSDAPSLLLFLTMTFSLVLIISGISYKYVERPLLKYFRIKLSRYTQ